MKKTKRDIQYQALAAFRYHIRSFLDFSDQAARAAGIEPKQYQLLLAVRGLPDDVSPTVGSISQQLRIRHHSTVELIDRAEKNDLVKRVKTGSYAFIRVTPKGERILADAVDERIRELRVAGPALVKALSRLITSHKRA